MRLLLDIFVFLVSPDRVADQRSQSGWSKLEGLTLLIIGLLLTGLLYSSRSSFEYALEREQYFRIVGSLFGVVFRALTCGIMIYLASQRFYPKQWKLWDVLMLSMHSMMIYFVSAALLALLPDEVVIPYNWFITWVWSALLFTRGIQIFYTTTFWRALFLVLFAKIFNWALLAPFFGLEI
ncbi:YIP1 family protein [Sanyastnella coralliicola]|uniref:YIP1 family protein n=1 Tax=Sanyastnella coralliicola TaxID=3069118 RepID=UPI0027B97716|nr:YIP1 family protein [Longitalea sp. SCSIO 12813]